MYVTVEGFYNTKYQVKKKKLKLKNKTKNHNRSEKIKKNDLLHSIQGKKKFSTRSLPLPPLLCQLLDIYINNSSTNWKSHTHTPIFLLPFFHSSLVFELSQVKKQALKSDPKKVPTTAYTKLNLI